jgi:hypothetical protein
MRVSLRLDSKALVKLDIAKPCVSQNAVCVTALSRYRPSSADHCARLRCVREVLRAAFIIECSWR